MGKVIDLKKVREERLLEEIAQDRKQRGYMKQPNGDEQAARIARIRKSLDRINELMSELKKISDNSDPKKAQK